MRLREKFNLHFWSYSQAKFKDCYGQTTKPALNPWNTQNLVLASSHLVRRTERIEELLAAEPWDLVILDEAHHARRKSPQQRKDTPNRLLQLMQQLRTKTESLILLSATPMQIDPIEVFDLVDILGLEGHWSYGENFCNYFSSLSDKPDSQTLDFWQTMSTDYFCRGGTECSRLGEHLVNSDCEASRRHRFLAYKLRDTWKDGKSIVNPKKLAKDTAFINASRHYLTVNTPLKDLMFRHTRDTLRQYYKLGILDRDIPRRIVSDNAIAMDYLRENLQQLYSSQVACYSGRGGELYRHGEWQTVPKEQIKKQFREGTIKLLLCTESASEGLNLQTCGVLIIRSALESYESRTAYRQNRSHRSSIFNS